MAFTRRKFRGNLKSLLHFDYPYYLEPGDGCRDEIGLMAWARRGNTKFVGTEIPNDAIVTETPKFGYRCAQFYTADDYIQGTNNLGIWDLSSDGNYEIEMFVRPTSSTAGNIFSLRDRFSDLLLLGKDRSNRLMLVSATLGLNKTSTTTLERDTFSHVLLRFSGGTARIFLNGTEVLSQSMTGGATLAPHEIRLGGFSGQMDEFAFRHSARAVAPTVPTQPYQGVVDLRAFEGAGNGVHGDVVLASTNVRINTYARVISVAGKNAVNIQNLNSGLYGDFGVGDEVLLHVRYKEKSSRLGEWQAGLYALRRIIKTNGSTIFLDRPVAEEFRLDSDLLARYYVQMVSVPNFRSLVVKTNASIVPYKGGYPLGGIVAFKCQKDCSLLGSIYLDESCAFRDDTLQMTHAQLLDRLLLGWGGGAFIVVGGTFTATSTARIGHTSDGSMKGGEGGGDSTQPTSGGAGYGGGGGGGLFAAVNYTVSNIGGRGGVGGGGGYSCCFDQGTSGRGGDAGKPASGRSSDNPGMAGTGGGSIATRFGDALRQYLDGGIAGQRLSVVNNPAGIYGRSGGAGGGLSGASIILIANKLNLATPAMSTGGHQGGAVMGGSQHRHGGGGTGFCFIAAGEMI